jgi:predicted metal-dependent phosphoesterase TrpH
MSKVEGAVKFADLHVHTACSDGTLTPEQLVKEALARGLSALAIVDHDTTEALGVAIAAAGGTGLEVIPGIELTAQHENQEIHILGYFLDYHNNELLEKLKSVRLNRIQRVYQIVKNLDELGVKLNPETVFSISGKATVGRMHIARALVKEGLVGSTAEAFRKYIGDKSPAYVLGFRLSVPEAIQLIQRAGGVAVLAHPYILHNDALITEFAGYGLQGLEVHYPEHSQSMVNFYLDLAKKLNLLVTGGTDFHGSVKPEIKLGMIKIPLELVEKLRQAKND